MADKRSSAASVQVSKSKAVFVVAKPVIIPSEDFVVSSKQSAMGKLNNSAYLKNLEAQLSYLPDAQRTDLIQLINSHLSLFSDTSSRNHLCSMT